MKNEHGHLYAQIRKLKKENRNLRDMWMHDVIQADSETFAMQMKYDEQFDKCKELLGLINRRDEEIERLKSEISDLKMQNENLIADFKGTEIELKNLRLKHSILQSNYDGMKTDALHWQDENAKLIERNAILRVRIAEVAEENENLNDTVFLIGDELYKANTELCYLDCIRATIDDYTERMKEFEEA